MVHAPRAAAAALAVTAALGLAACGGDSSSDKAADAASSAVAAASSVQAEVGAAASSAVAAATSAAGAAVDAGVAAAGDPAAGKEVFSGTCAACHTLADAGASGQVGPNLDDLKPDATLVVTTVTNGKGGMPALGGTLKPEDIANVAAYVSSVAGQ